jgi:hypothetical protein
MAEAVRQRYAVATGKDAGLPKPSSTPRAKHGGRVDKTEMKKYGNGFRAHKK